MVNTLFLVFVQTLINTDGTQELETEYAEYRHLRFEIYHSQKNKGKHGFTLSGSLHKYAQGGYNYGRFDFLRLCEVIAEICGKFHLKPDLCMMEPFEFAVNLRNFFIPTDTLLRSILLFKTGKGKRETGDDRDSKFFRQTQYQLKFYDKPKHLKGLNLPFSEFRAEIHLYKMEFIKRLGIKTLADLMNRQKVEALGQILASVCDKLLIRDPRIHRNQLTPTEWEVFNTNREDWEELHKDNPNKFNKRRRRFWAICKKYQPESLNQILNAAILKEWAYLLNTEQAELSTPEYQRTGTILTRKEDNDEGGDWHQFDPLSYRSNPYLPATHGTRQCKTCRRDISHRKAIARFCEDKACRNADSNPRNHSREKYGTDFGLRLFD